jgi:hypothetical protein
MCFIRECTAWRPSLLKQLFLTVVCTIILIIFMNSLETCIGPLGLESGAIQDKDITASSAFEHSSVGPHNAR